MKMQKLQNPQARRVFKEISPQMNQSCVSVGWPQLQFYIMITNLDFTWPPERDQASEKRPVPSPPWAPKDSHQIRMLHQPLELNLS